MQQPIDIAKTFLHLRNGGDAAPVKVTASFWRATEQREGFVLGAVDFATPRDLHSSHAEMHPEADEVLLLVSGALDVVLEDGDGQKTLALAAGQAAIVPRGVWHHLVMREPGRLVF